MLFPLSSAAPDPSRGTRSGYNFVGDAAAAGKVLGEISGNAHFPAKRAALGASDFVVIK